MARRKKVVKVIFGVLIGVLISQFFHTGFVVEETMCNTRRRHKNEDAFQKGDPKQNLIFVGVMTAAQYTDTRAKAIYDTWGRTVPGSIQFFSSEYSHHEEIPLVSLVGVDDSYPPQKKSFMMLKYMYDHYIDKFEWFLRADDDVYVKTDQLEDLLRSIDSKKPWFIGQTGRGNTEEFGMLSLEDDENFCMGGPGVIFSRETLKRVAPYIEECLKNVYTTHEDVELGRCVRKFARISCTWSYEMQVILYHNQSGHASFTGDLKQKEVHRAITLHPIKEPFHMYRLNKYVKGLKLQNFQQESINVHRDIASSMSKLGYRKDHLSGAILAKNLSLFPAQKGTPDHLGDTKLLGIEQSLNRHKPVNLDDVLDWELISKTLYSYKDLNPRRRIGSSLKMGLNSVVGEIMELINLFSKQRGRIIDFKEILYGYWRLDPAHGVDLILDLLLVYKKYRGHKMTVQVRRHAYVQQTFAGISIRELTSSNFPLMSQKSPTSREVPIHKKIVQRIISTFEENLQPIFNFSNSAKEYINFIVPLSGRFETFKRFMKMYEEVCIKQNEAVKLFIILYPSQDFEDSDRLIKTLQHIYPNTVITVIYVKNETFIRGKALEYGVKLVSKDDLMLFIDVDMIFDSTSLQRIRKNTVKRQSLYFPIVYSLYSQKILNETYPVDEFSFDIPRIINEDSGYWRQFGFGIVSLYKSDYLDLGGFNLSIRGWGFEDVTFFDNAIKSEMKIMRCVDPSLIHVYHSVSCDNNLDSAQKNMCLGSHANTLGSLKKLQKLYKSYQQLFVS